MSLQCDPCKHCIRSPTEKYIQKDITISLKLCVLSLCVMQLLVACSWSLTLAVLNIMCFNFSGNSEAMERIAYELCEDQAACGVVYFEARYSPHCLVDNSLLSTNCVHKGESNMTPRAAVQSVNRGLQRGETDFGVKARSILCCIRGRPGMWV